MGLPTQEESLMRVLIVCPNYSTRGWLSPEDLETLPDNCIYSDYECDSIVDISDVNPMEAHYDLRFDALCWVADLAFVAIGMTTNAPKFDDKFFFSESSAEVKAVDCQHDQPPVLYVS
jgi:hypothetical protein